jgi:hypothetical protein
VGISLTVIEASSVVGAEGLVTVSATVVMAAPIVSSTMPLRGNIGPTCLGITPSGLVVAVDLLL